MLLLTKIMPTWKSHVCTGCGISTNWHGGLDNNMAGTRQVNTLCGDSCRDGSCLVINHVENKNIGTTMKSPCTNMEEKLASISHPDDAYLMSDGEDNVEKCKKSSLCMMITMVLLVEK